MAEGHVTIRVRRRPWWFWLLALAWLAAEILVAQTAIASGQEGEPRAAAISWLVAAVMTAAGLRVWVRSGRTA